MAARRVSARLTGGGAGCGGARVCDVEGSGCGLWRAGPGVAARRVSARLTGGDQCRVDAALLLIPSRRPPPAAALSWSMAAAARPARAEIRRHRAPRWCHDGSTMVPI